jgi:hypothetical protein
MMGDDSTSVAATLSWTQPCCERCWVESVGRLADGTLRKPRLMHNWEHGETCAWCGQETVIGLYIRLDPQEVAYPSAKGVGDTADVEVTGHAVDAMIAALGRVSPDNPATVRAVARALGNHWKIDQEFRPLRCSCGGWDPTAGAWENHQARHVLAGLALLLSVDEEERGRL